MIELPDLETLDAEQLRHAVRQLAQQVKFNQALIDKLTHENALLKRLKFAAQSERHTPEQRSLLEDEIEADLAAVVRISAHRGRHFRLMVDGIST